MKRRDIRMPGRRIAHALRLAEAGRGQTVGETQRIGIPTREVQRLAHLVMIEVEERPHEIVGDEPPRRVTADDRNLLGVERHDLIRREAMEIEPVDRVQLGHSPHRQIDLIERAVRHAPEAIAPSLVQRADVAVPRTQPLPECTEGARRVRTHCVVATVFIVRLPTRNRRVLAVTRRERLGDAPAFAAIRVA